MRDFVYRFFDEPILLAVNSLSNHSKLFDLMVDRFMMLETVRILPIVAAIIFVAYSDSSKVAGKQNETFTVAIAGSFLAILISRIAQNISERPRPIYAHIEGFLPPFGMKQDIPADWSSFPSDTSALVFALATAVFLKSRALGSLCIVWALVVASLPRIYTGYHYPSDVVAGIFIGVVSTIVASACMPTRLLDAGETLRQRHAALYHAGLFVILYLTATMFSDIRQTLSAVGEFIL